MKLLLVPFLFLISCAAVPAPVGKIPVPVESQVISFSETGKMDAGILDYNDSVGFLITKSTADRFRYLCNTIGQSYAPPLNADDYLVPAGPNFVLSEAGMTEYLTLVEKSR